MTILSERLRAVFAVKGITNQAEFARRVGTSRATVGGWINGRTLFIDAEYLLATANVLGVSPEWLRDGDPARIEWAQPPKQAGRMIPVISEIQAGDPRHVVDAYATGDGMEPVWIDPQAARAYGKHTFALRVSGDSMLPDFRPGDIVIVDPDAPYRPGDIVVGKLEADEAATLKRYRARGRDTAGGEVFELQPLNDAYPTITISRDNPGRVVGVVMEVHKKLRLA